jgi:hypothetical protein
MAIVNLGAIIAKVRRLTGSADPLQLPDSAVPADSSSVGITDYIDSFYLYDFPAQFRSLKLKDKYTFNTTFGIDTYAFNSEQYTTVEMPCYCAKREIKLFNDPWSFYGVNFNWQSMTNFDSGDGTTGPYSGVTTGNPILRSINNNSTDIDGTPNVPGVSQGSPGYAAGRVQNILITANISNGTTVNVTDDGAGNLIGNCTAGTINYGTGAISGLVFTQGVPQGNAIQIQYNPVQPNIPLSILFFQNQFTLRPVPDKGYTIELIAYRQPSQALKQTAANAGTPELSEWWECIAIGAAKKIFEDRLDSDGIALMDKMLAERYQMVYTRTYAQLGKQRVNTIFADQLSQNYGSGGWGSGSGSV